jgi:putative colanic acid biosynthesis acetyltransferase WcaF
LATIHRIGERDWLDSFEKIKIGSHCCISQGAHLCTGNHDWTDPAFGLIVKPITVEDGAWVGARATILPGVTLGRHSILTAGSTISKNTDPNMIYVGNPAQPVKERSGKLEQCFC